MSSLDTLDSKESVQAKEQVKEQVNREKIRKLLKLLKECNTPQSRKNILDLLNLSNHTTNYKNNILKLVDAKLLEYTMPGKLKSPDQKYATSGKGKKLLDIFSNYESN